MKLANKQADENINQPCQMVEAKLIPTSINTDSMTSASYLEGRRILRCGQHVDDNINNIEIRYCPVLVRPPDISTDLRSS